MADRKQVLDQFLKHHPLPGKLLEKIQSPSFRTDKFAYQAMRIGNSIGDIKKTAAELVFLELLAAKFGLDLDTTEHPSLQTREVTEEALGALVKAALKFESILEDGAQHDFFKRKLPKVTEAIADNLKNLL